MEKENIDKEFTDINKGIENKNYIIVIILYIVVAILYVFFILGIKNQKDTVKDNIDSNEQIEETKDKNNTQTSKEEKEDINTQTQEEQKAKDSETKDSNNLFDDTHKQVDDFNSKQNERLEEEMNKLNQLG